MLLISIAQALIWASLVTLIVMINPPTIWLWPAVFIMTAAGSFVEKLTTEFLINRFNRD